MQILISTLMGIANALALLVGWGDPWTFWNDVPRAVVGAVIIIAPATIALIAPNAGGGDHDHILGQRVRVLGSIAIILPICYWAVAAFESNHYWLRPEIVWVRWAGLLTTVAGGNFMLWSIIRLGKQYSIYVTRQEQHSLVRSGPYKLIRHPIYLGFVVWMLGFAFVFRSWGGLLIWLVVLAGTISKLRREERFMHEQFSTGYAEYARRTWRLIPFVY